MNPHPVKKLTTQRKSQNNITKIFKVRVALKEFHHRRAVMIRVTRRIPLSSQLQMYAKKLP
jgi:hypothetical protein